MSSSYSDKYKDYYYKNSFYDSFTYMIKLKNFNNNNVWPLTSCPHCSTDIKSQPARKVEFYFNKENKRKGTILPIIFFSAFFLFIAFALKGNLVLSISLCGLFSALLLVYLKYYVTTSPLELYFCSNCDVLLYNTSPKKIVSSEPPKIIFERLEQLKDFELR